jgi:molecular chaperone DnaK
MRRSLGIDLGTTNSVVASRAQVLPLRDGNETIPLLPSVLALLPNGGALVGVEAKARRPLDPRNTVYASKRLMGEHWTSYATRQFRAQYPHELAPAPEGGVQFVTRAGAILPEEVAALIMSHLCMRAGVRPDEHATVVGVPTAFHGPARKATLRALERVGFQEARIVEEPVATAIAYLQRSNLRYAAVYDFGGGTFDLAIIDCSSFPFRVLSHAGDPYLGGDDVDRALAERVADRTLRTTGWDLRSDPVTFARLVLACEQVKCALTREESGTLDLSEVDPAAPPLPPAHIDRDMLREVSEPLIRRTFGLCDQVLGEAGLRARDIQAVFLAGGSTRLPILHGMVSEYFGRKLRSDIVPEHVVATGASIAAARPELWPLLEQSA